MREKGMGRKKGNRERGERCGAETGKGEERGDGSGGEDRK